MHCCIVFSSGLISNIRLIYVSICCFAVSKEDHSNNDCFVCVILSHGEEGYVWGHDDRIALNELIKPIKGNNCTTLAGKPKIFFIQVIENGRVFQMPCCIQIRLFYIITLNLICRVIHFFVCICYIATENIHIPQSLNVQLISYHLHIMVQ